MDCYLLIDFGSTYTKLTVVDIENEEILITSKDITTVETDIMIGFENALNKISSFIEEKKVNFVKKLACSSAAGGLKMAALGLVPELTTEAAKRAALGAGAKVQKVYSFEITNKEIDEIKNNKTDIILLAGGTDGGNKKCIIHNASMIAKHKLNIPVVVAGNKSCQDEIEDIFKQGNISYRICENVMPKLNKLNVEPAKEEIRKIFMEKIIEAKGMKTAENYINGILMPTPAAVLNAAECLCEGTAKEDGIGELMVIDVGGATTDVHSISKGDPVSDIEFRGLEEPFAKRTVEGDLGMRYSAHSLFLAAGDKRIKKYLNDDTIDVEKECIYRNENIKMVPKNKKDEEFDEAIAKCATELAIERHVGHLEWIHSPIGPVYYQYGKDLTLVKYLIATGGVIIHSNHPKEILKAGLYNEKEFHILKPKSPEYLIDKSYIFSAMGLLSIDFKDKAIRIMKKYIEKI